MTSQIKWSTRLTVQKYKKNKQMKELSAISCQLSAISYQLSGFSFQFLQIQNYQQKIYKLQNPNLWSLVSSLRLLTFDIW